MLTGGEIIKEFFDHYKIEYLFGNPGTTETTFLEAISHCETTKFILGLQEASVVGMAAGYAIFTRKPAVVNIHTYPGLANSIANMYNAYTSGIPLFVIAGQQDQRHLIHRPLLSGELTKLAETATKYQYQVTRAEDLDVALQRCYSQASMSPPGPTFLSIPLDILNGTTDKTCFKNTQVLDDACVNDLTVLIDLIKKTEPGKLAFIADYEAGESIAEESLSLLAESLQADIFAAPYHVRRVAEPRHPHFKGHLPALSGKIHDILATYQTVILLGEKVSVFLFTGKQAIPNEVTLVQICAAGNQLSFDYPCDLAILGDVNGTLKRLLEQLNIKESPATSKTEATKIDLDALAKQFGLPSGNGSFVEMTYKILSSLDKSTSLLTEGSSVDLCVQQIALHLSFEDVHFSPRGGGLGWAMPVAVGLSLASQRHSVCFVGDGGSMFSIHVLWSAAKYKIPVIFICYVNNEYKILKDLWCMQKNTKIESTQFIGLDFNDPAVNLQKVAEGFGAKAVHLKSLSAVEETMQQALAHQGPSFIMIDK